MSTTIEARALHDAQKLGRNRHTRKHAHVTTTGVAGGKTADDGPYRAENDANGLPHRCAALMTTNRNLEHEPVDENMPPNRCLAEDVSAFEMNEGSVKVASFHQLSAQRDFVAERFLVRGVHATVSATGMPPSLPEENGGFRADASSESKAAGHMAADKRPS